MYENKEVILTRGVSESNSFPSRAEQDAYDRGHAVGFRDHALVSLPIQKDRDKAVAALQWIYDNGAHATKMELWAEVQRYFKSIKLNKENKS